MSQRKSSTHSRIGPCMAEVARLADRPGGIAVIDAAGRVGPHGSLCYGYQSVHRAIRAGLVVVGRAQEPGRRGMILTTL
jgi:hypothetical protein